MKKIICFLALAGHIALLAAQPRITDAERAYQQTLTVLGEALLSVQNTDEQDPDFGGLADPESGIYYSRAAEAVFPFAVLYKRTGDQKYRQAAIRLGNWLLRQQQAGGEWVENPWTWTGTTADQLIMMSSAYPILLPHLHETERKTWPEGISRAADYLTLKMSPDFASINYVPTTAGALAVTWKNVRQKPEWRDKARLLANQTLAKMDEDYFIEGEAARYHDVKYGIDIGYQVDMSLWGLAVYAQIFEDKTALDAVRASLERLSYFFYPNGALDASWGARCYKWTGYGSKTADGCQVLLSMFAHENPAYQTIALRNLDYLRTAIQGGFVGYGKHIWGIPGKKANLYPTFARAKNLAMALEWGRHQPGQTPPMPSDRPNWVRYYPTTKVGLIRQGPWMATFSAYDYTDGDNWGKGKYHHFPHGGTRCNLYLDGWGWITTSTQTIYNRGEHIHMPAIEDSIVCLTPRFEFKDKRGYFTNVYDSRADLSVEKNLQGAAVRVRGALCDSLGRPGGVAFVAEQFFTDQAIRTKVHFRYHDRSPVIRFEEPIVLEQDVELRLVDERSVEIKGPAGKKLFFRVLTPNVRLTVGDNRQRYWHPFPGLRALPIAMEVAALQSGFSQIVDYELSME
jgi:hypothetical protein